MRARSNNYKIRVFILSAVLLIGIYKFSGYMFATSDYFNERFQSTLAGNSSGRDEIYSTMYEYFLNDRSVFNILFGYGLNGTDSLFGNGAHNDWLEFAIDMGLLGLISYFVYWLLFYKTWKLTKNMRVVHVALGVILVSELLKTFFSFSINDMPLQEIPALGYCLAMLDFSKHNIKISQ